MKRAYFAIHPRKIEDCAAVHDLSEETTYTITAKVVLTAMDYENFVSDMLVERQFLEDNASACGRDGDAVRCILVQTKWSKDGVLVLADKDGFVVLAAGYKG